MRERIRVALDSRKGARHGLEIRLRRFDMRPRLAADWRRMEAAQTAAAAIMHRHLAQRRSAFDQLAGKLSQLSPVRILERGYAIVSNENGIVKDAAAAPTGTGIHVRLGRGELDATVR